MTFERFSTRARTRFSRAGALVVVASLSLLSSTATAAQDDGAPPAAPQENALEYVHMTTSKGEIVLELNREKAPVTVANFLQYAADDFYDETIFHRVISNFMIQGGGFTADLTRKETRAPIKNEYTNGLSNVRGSIAMARTSDPDSASSQFFINVEDNTPLDKADPRFGGAAYCVFGKVIAGMKTVDAIRKVSTATRTDSNGQPFQNVPVEPVTINDVVRISKERADDLKKTIDQAGDG